MRIKCEICIKVLTQTEKQIFVTSISRQVKCNNLKRMREEEKANKNEEGQIKPTCFKKVLHKLHGNSGFHFHTFSLNGSKDFTVFYCFSINRRNFSGKIY